MRWGIPVLALAGLILSRGVWLSAFGGFLVNSQSPFKADIVLVLAGDEHGNRLLKAAELVNAGYAPRILVSGPLCCYGNRESDLAIGFAVKHGVPPEWLISFPIQGSSTRAEAKEILAELRRLGVKRFLVVTSNYHTRRAGAIYRSMAAPETFRVVAAPDWAFSPEAWWRSREGQKQVFFEWSKTIGNWLGL